MADRKIYIALKEQDSQISPKEIKATVVSEGGQLWIKPQGYGCHDSADDEGFPIGIEIWHGRLRLIVFDDINSEEPQIIDLERAKDSAQRHT